MTRQLSRPLADLYQKIGVRDRKVMKRCFMTGKQCIFSSQVAEGASFSSGNTNDEYDLNVFIVMPYRPNLETFYRWSLKPFLVQGYGMAEEYVQRADEVRDIGYVVCEKICRKIQEADLILSEVTYSNPNVFYEIGLSYGLNCPIVLLRNGGTRNWSTNDNCVRQSLDIQEEKLFSYPGIDILDVNSDRYDLSRCVTHPPKYEGGKRELKITVLRIVRDQDIENTATQAQDDIDLEFNNVLSGAVGVAMAEIRNDIKQENGKYSHEPWINVVREIDDNSWKKFSSTNDKVVDGRSNFYEIAGSVSSSFCTLIDVSSNDPVACFWLGYCHARGLNAIPVYRIPGTVVNDEINAETSIKEHRLAFDIRALWYAEYDSGKPYEFKTKIREILEHLIERDLPDRQKRGFWERFPAEKKLRVFTGAIHNDSLNREMVGDWDVRTVSELFSYLPSVREARDIELVTPLYSPEEAFRRYNENNQINTGENEKKVKKEFIEDYRKGIENQLRGCSAIVIASPDVNPVTEYLLHKIYNVEIPSEPFDSSQTPKFKYPGYVVYKKLRQPQDRGFSRIFYHEESINDDEEPTRGFAIYSLRTRDTGDKSLMIPYLSQDDCREPFSLLGHLVIARNPLDEVNSDNLVVLLNGVSGPATFALAQILTGGGGLHITPGNEANLESKSEKMLLKINDILDTQGCIGIEAIIEIKIMPSVSSESTSQNQTFVDSRHVYDWDFIRGPEPLMVRPVSRP